MRGKSCELYPKVSNGEDSKMYKDLLEAVKNRPMTNMFYASYLASNIGDAMDNAGIQRNNQGQHRAPDLLKFIDYYTAIAPEINSMAAEEENLGAVDANGQRIDYTDAKEALDKADYFNDHHKGLVANVYQHGDVFNIIVSEKNARTLMHPIEVKQRLQVWNVEKQVFAAAGINLDNAPQGLKSMINPHNIGLIKQLQNLKRTQFNFLSRQSAMALLFLNQNSVLVQRAINSFGSIEAAADAVDNIIHGVAVPHHQIRLLVNAINNAMQFNGINLDALETQVNQISQQALSSSPEAATRSMLHKLNKKYKIDINEVHKTDQKIRTLSDAVATAAITLQRQIREIQKREGNNAEGKKLSGILDQLLKELAAKRYYSGILNFLQEANAQIGNIDSILNNVPQTGTDIEIAFGKAKILQQVKELWQQYYPLVDALSNDHLAIDESVNQIDIDTVRQLAKDMKSEFDKRVANVNDRIERTMVDLLTKLIGDTAPDGQTIANVIRMAQADSSAFDWLYSVGRASNPIIAAMGRVIRSAQDSRDAVMNDISLRLRRATDKLYKSGSDSQFIYQDDGHIISDIDWVIYDNAMKQHRDDLIRNGLRGFDLKQAMEEWVERNTEERVVDVKSGRTERVPNSNYRLNNGMKWDAQNNRMTFTSQSKLTKAQQDYYNETMQVKGEIGTLLPEYARNHYLPPQIRRNMVDAIANAKNANDVWEAIKKKAQNFYKIREDDTEFASNGTIIDGQQYQMVESGYDNSPIREIPIFFVNRVEEGELLKDFSSGLAHLAGTAINYDAMNSIADVVQFIGDYAADKAVRHKDPKADYVSNAVIGVTYDLVKQSQKSGVAGLVEGYIAQHIYGQRLDPESFGYKWAKPILNLIGYTSFKGLVTNVKGALSNYLVGEFQMLIEAGAGEFYGLKDYAWAHTKLFGKAGVGGEIMELLTNNMNSKGTLFRELFDPINENFSDKSNIRYHKSMFRQLLSKDCSFIGYASGEYLIHYVNMYSILHRQKVLLNGREISLYDAFEVTNKQDGNSELKLKQGVTTIEGQPVTAEWIEKIRERIRYANQTTHGSMNTEDKGLIHQKLWGRAVMNFRQWMVEHYSRRFRKAHFDATLRETREGYWVSFYKYMFNDDTKDAWNDGKKLNAVGMFAKDLLTFALRAQSQWHNLTEAQRHNVNRVHTEMTMYLALLGLGFALGEPDKHKKEAWRRWWIYQVKRLQLDTEASMPNLNMVSSAITVLQSPIASVNTLNALLYTFYGLTNGDLWTEIKSGPHKGENKYWRNFMKYDLPFFKDWEQMQRMSEDESIFKVFENTPSNY